VDENIRVAIANGVPPVVAVQMATINVAQAFNLQMDVGAIAPGRYADILLVDDLVTFSLHEALIGGESVVRQDRLLISLPEITYPTSFYDTVRLGRPITDGDLRPQARSLESVEVRVIGVGEGSLETSEERARLEVVDGVICPDLANDILPLAMADRFAKGERRIGLGFVRGFTLRAGAIASTVNAVCENLVAVGADTSDMDVAMNMLARVGVGKVVVLHGEVVALVELPVLGLLSQERLDTVIRQFDTAFGKIRDLGCQFRNPFSQLEFSFACGEIGALRLSDEGLLRTNPPESVDLIIG
jgi:adenine deaminase